ncbi:MAG: NAD-dependent epimerase/dehydratase family protein, partial [Halioglobus sp.]|nr:NAD-dependent epimerase/dehydratase family protein [Halioglobus sp.]
SADLDLPIATLPSAACVIYTVAPSAEHEPDPRLPHFLKALGALPHRLVYFSTTGVYGDAGGERVHEDDTLNPRSGRAHRRFAAESLLRQWSADHGVELTILRVPAIYGPGRLGLERLRAKEPLLQETDAGPGNRIHVDDLVNCALAAADPARPPGVYNVGDGDHRSSTWFATTVATLAGLSVPESVPMAEAKRRWSPQRLSFLQESRRVDLRRMYDELRICPRYADATEGIRASHNEQPDHVRRP